MRTWPSPPAGRTTRIAKRSLARGEVQARFNRAGHPRPCPPPRVAWRGIGLAGQALVEFALIAPVLLLLIGASVDLGRGVLIFNLLSGAARETARMAALEDNSGSNTLPAPCTSLATPCSQMSVVTGAHLLDSLGVSVVYQDSTTIGAPPAYGTYVANADPTQPGTITLTGGASSNTVYVFIYELDSNSGNPSPRWACSTAACATTYGSAARTSGHQRVVVDLKIKWQPVLAKFLGIPTVLTFDAQAVDRIEF